jgi:dUTP pyrophosphatase
MTGIDIKFHRIHPNAVIPEYANYDDSGADVFLVEDLIIPARGIGFSPLGFSVEIPQGLELQFRSKSGMAKSRGLFVLNSPGTIDAGYRGELAVILANFSDVEVKLTAESKVGQLVLCPVYYAVYREEHRAAGGFGSTGLSKKAEVIKLPINHALNLNILGDVAELARPTSNDSSQAKMDMIVETDRPSLKIS